MTTIVYKSGIIAYDSQATVGSTVQSQNLQKAVRVDNLIFVFAGTWGEREALIDAYLRKEADKDIDCSALVVDDGMIYACGVEQGKFFRFNIDKTEVFALGSGEEYAYGAMDMGADAKQAVQVAAKRDIYTGGKIRTIKI